MRVQIEDLSGAALDWAVAKCEEVHDGRLTVIRREDYIGYPIEREAERDSAPVFVRWCPSRDWAQGGLIIEREGIGLVSEARDHSLWRAQFNYTRQVLRLRPMELVQSYCLQRGPTALVAAMRCYVASKLGDTVDVPDELGGK